MKKYLCTAKCPELDKNNEEHCIFTQLYIDEKREYDLELCPAGNDVNLVVSIEPTP